MQPPLEKINHQEATRMLVEMQQLVNGHATWQDKLVKKMAADAELITVLHNFIAMHCLRHAAEHTGCDVRRVIAPSIISAGMLCAKRGYENVDGEIVRLLFTAVFSRSNSDNWFWVKDATLCVFEYAQLTSSENDTSQMSVVQN